MRLPVLLLCSLALAAPGSSQELTLTIPPSRIAFDIDGLKLGISAWGVVSRASPAAFRLSLTADLGDLQANITPLLVAQLNRSDRCGERISVEHATLTPAAPAARLTVNLHYERWGCAKVFGKEVVKRLVGGDGTIVVKLTPSMEPHGIALSPEVVKIEADGSLGEVLRSGTLGDSVKEKIASSIERAIRKGFEFKSALPPPIAEAATIQSVEFAPGPEDKLWILLTGEVRISADQFQSLIKR